MLIYVNLCMIESEAVPRVADDSDEVMRMVKVIKEVAVKLGQSFVHLKVPVQFDP